MKKPSPQQDWPESWKLSYHYDELELGDDRSDPGYTYAYAVRSQKTKQLLNEAGPAGGRILDVAAAQGNFTLSLAELGFRVTWNDLRAELIPYVQAKYERGEVHYAPGNVFDLAPDSPFDVVLLTEIIEHVAHPDEFLRKIADLVKPGGSVVLTTPNGGYFRNTLPKFSECADPTQYEARQFKPDADGHIFLLHQDEMESLAREAGLTLVSSAPHTNFLTNGYAKTRFLLKVIPRWAVFQIERLAAALPLSWQWKFSTGMAVLLRKPS